jgi:hypothetical protein
MKSTALFAGPDIQVRIWLYIQAPDVINGAQDYSNLILFGLPPRGVDDLVCFSPSCRGK